MQQPHSLFAAACDDGTALRSAIGAIAGLQAPVRRALIALAGRFVDAQAWNPLGFASLRDYATERLGVSSRSLLDWAHVDRALAQLPWIDAALSEGSIGWTQARLLVRAATPEDERRWIARARCMSARALEKEVRRVDRGSLEAGAAEGDGDDDVADTREGFRVRCTPAVRARWFRVRQVANRVSGERVPAWCAMEAVAAEVSSEFAPQADTQGAMFDARPALGRQSRVRPVPDIADCGEPAHTWMVGLSQDLRSLVVGLEQADARSLDDRLRRSIAIEQRIEARLGPLLLDLADKRSHRDWGFSSFEAYVHECLPMSPRRARALLRIERAGRRCPALCDAYRGAAISWVQAHTLVPVALAGDAPVQAWIDWARRVSVRRLERDVDVAVSRCAVEGSRFPAPPGPDASNDHDLDRAAEALERQARARATVSQETAAPFWSAPKNAMRFFRAVLCSVRRALERHEPGRVVTEGEAFGAMLDHALEAWGANDPKVRRSHRVFARDGWRCTAPGCTSQRNLHDHHIRFRSAGGSNEMANRTTLCAWHHQRGVHAGIVRCSGSAPDGLCFEFGVEPGREPWLVFASGDVVVRG